MKPVRESLHQANPPDTRRNDHHPTREETPASSDQDTMRAAKTSAPVDIKETEGTTSEAPAAKRARVSSVTSMVEAKRSSEQSAVAKLEPSDEESVDDYEAEQERRTFEMLRHRIAKPKPLKEKDVRAHRIPDLVRTFLDLGDDQKVHPVWHTMAQHFNQGAIENDFAQFLSDIPYYCKGEGKVGYNQIKAMVNKILTTLEATYSSRESEASKQTFESLKNHCLDNARESLNDCRDRLIVFLMLMKLECDKVLSPTNMESIDQDIRTIHCIMAFVNDVHIHQGSPQTQLVYTKKDASGPGEFVLFSSIATEHYESFDIRDPIEDILFFINAFIEEGNIKHVPCIKEEWGPVKTISSPDHVAASMNYLKSLVGINAKNT